MDQVQGLSPVLARGDFEPGSSESVLHGLSDDWIILNNQYVRHALPHLCPPFVGHANIMAWVCGNSNGFNKSVT
jgi:hypothetical protein